jgi:hypothetical protein
MSLYEYTGILIKGYLENRDNLAKYLIRESKNAEKEFIDNEEFFDGLNKVIELFHTDIENQYYKRKINVLRIKSIREEKGQSIEDLEDQVFPKENYYIFLPRVTGNRFTGNLSFHEIQFLEMAINEAKQNFNHYGKSQSGTASKGKIIYNENDTIILSVETIKALHEFCKENDFFKSEFEYSDFFNCFNLSKPINVYPEFKHSYKTKFVFLIQNLVNLTNDQAKERFNIPSYSNLIQRNENDTKSKSKSSVIKGKMNAFIRKHKTGINNN